MGTEIYRSILIIIYGKCFIRNLNIHHSADIIIKQTNKNHKIPSAGKHVEKLVPLFIVGNIEWCKLSYRKQFGGSSEN